MGCSAALLDKLLILKENKAQAGVYRWINLTNGKSYIGSSSNLGRRFTEYFSIQGLRPWKVEKGRIKKDIMKKLFYSTKPCNVIPAVTYSNADIDKVKIINDNRGKAGVYQWVNKVNGKSYVGSSSNLGRRFTEYFSIYKLETQIKKGRSIICQSLLKQGYSNFIFEILEYCEASEAVSREQYYLDLLKPEYNILKFAGSPYGRKHSPEAIAKMKNPKFLAKRLEHLKRLNSSPEHKEHLKRLHSSLEQKAKLLERLKILNSSQAQQERLFKFIASISQKVEVFDTLTKETTVYPSISEAARSIGCTNSAIVIALKNQKEKGVTKLVKKRYTVFLKTDESKIAGTSSPSSAPQGLKRTWESNAHRVQVMDTLNGNKTVYGSIREAAVGIGCVHATILNALKYFKETGETRLIKKRFQVKHI